MSTSACNVFEIRMSQENFNDVSHVRQILSLYSKKYTFQLEKGDTGYMHYQGRISLIKKRREHEIKKVMEKNDHLKLFNFIKPTTLTEYKNEAFYCMKLDTRIEGPYTDQDFIPTETKQLQIFKQYTLRPYQQELIKLTQQFSLRHIHLIYDPIGNIGKSLLTEYLEYLGHTEEIPPFRLMEDIFQWVYGRPTKNTYTIDLPRGMKKDKLGEFYAGIEVIKNGVAYDKRHNPKKKRFNRPNIIVFTNMMPNLELMSMDRWIICEVDENYNLIKKSPEDFF